MATLASLTKPDLSSMNWSKIFETYDNNFQLLLDTLNDLNNKFVVETHTEVTSDTITLDNNYVIGSNSLMVFMNGIPQWIGESYIELSTNSIKLTFTPESSDVFKIMVLKVLNVEGGSEALLTSIQSSLSALNTEITALQGSVTTLSDKIREVSYYSGGSSNHPTTNLVVGLMYLNTDTNTPEWWNGKSWITSQAPLVSYDTLPTPTVDYLYKLILMSNHLYICLYNGSAYYWKSLDHYSGTTAARPTTPYIGQLYYNTDTNFPEWWTGTDWINNQALLPSFSEFPTASLDYYNRLIIVNSHVYLCTLENSNYVWRIMDHQCGGTSTRPTTNLYRGMLYYNTDTDQPEWWNGSKWIATSGGSSTTSDILTPVTLTYNTDGSIATINDNGVTYTVNRDSNGVLTSLVSADKKIVCNYNEYGQFLGTTIEEAT